MDRDFWTDFVAGWMGGCAGLLAGHPMDTIKTRQQVMHKMSAFSCIVNTVKHEGGRAFYKGMAVPLLTTGALNSMFFGFYGLGLRYLAKGEQQPKYSTIYAAGCIGGLFQLIVATPVDLVKIKMQVQMDSAHKSWGKDAKALYKSPFHCITELYRERGIRGCYKGLVAMAIRDVPSFGLYILIYEWFIRTLAGKEENARKIDHVISGSMAGGLSWMTIGPIDVLKSRFQADDDKNPKFKGLYDCMVKSYRNEGITVFTRGFFMVIVRAVPTNGAIFLGYGMAMNFLRRNTNENSV